MHILDVIVNKPCLMCGGGVDLKLTLLHLTSNNYFMCWFFPFVAKNHRRGGSMMGLLCQRRIKRRRATQKITQNNRNTFLYFPLRAFLFMCKYRVRKGEQHIACCYYVIIEQAYRRTMDTVIQPTPLIILGNYRMTSGEH